MELIHEGLGVNEYGNLTIGGADAVELAKEFGTPLYVFDERSIRTACRQFKNSVDDYYDGNGMVLYASKAFACKEMYRIVAKEGLGIDIVSAGELYTAMSVDFPVERAVFHGNNKTPDELEYAVDCGVGRIVVDNLTELYLLDEIAKKKGKMVKIMMRIKPGIDAHTHSFVRTGQIDSKFGFALETGEAIEAAVKAVSMDNVELCGVHCHIGSQIFDVDPFCLAAKVMIKFMNEIKERTGKELNELNLGGGFGIKYIESDAALPFENFLSAVSEVVKAQCDKRNFKMPKILIEPGRAIIAPAGTTLYTVGCVKDIPDIRTYVSVDGGMSDNPRYALYQSNYEVLIANKASLPKDKIVTVAGKCCESGDLIQENAPIQETEVGDILAVFSTGAYNYSMASNYNRIPRPAAVMVKNGNARVIIKRETFEDLVRNDI